jgi:hypothetical protein
MGEKEVDTNMLMSIAIAILTAGGVVLGFMLKTIYFKSEANEMALNAHKIEAAGNFVKREEMAVSMASVRTDFATAITNVRADNRADNDRLEKRFDKMEDWLGRRFDEVLSRQKKVSEG